MALTALEPPEMIPPLPPGPPTSPGPSPLFPPPPTEPPVESIPVMWLVAAVMKNWRMADALN